MELNHRYLAEYVRRARNGDSDAFAELYTGTYDKVYNYCRHYLRDEFLAQDAVQEVFISALKNLQKLNDPTLFVAWVNQIAFHTCYDICKRNSNDYGCIDEEIMEAVSDSSKEANPEMSYMEKDEYRRLNEAINLLNPTYKHLITLRYINNHKIDEIVDMTDFSKSTVKRYLEKAIIELQKLMKD